MQVAIRPIGELGLNLDVYWSLIVAPASSPFIWLSLVENAHRVVGTELVPTRILRSSPCPSRLALKLRPVDIQGCALMNLLTVEPFRHFEVAVLPQGGKELLLLIPRCNRRYFSFVELSSPVLGRHLIVIISAAQLASLILLNEWHSP